MLILVAFVLGCAIGWVRAARQGGALAHRIQYALAHGIPMGLAVLVLLIVGSHLGWLP